MSAKYLIDRWITEAKRHRAAQSEIERGDDEWMLHKVEADRLEQCASELATHYEVFGGIRSAVGASRE